MTKAIKAPKQIPAKKLGPVKAIAKPKKLTKWIDLKKIAPGEILSCFQYMKVTRIVGSSIDLRRTDGKVICIDKSILVEDSYSADHYNRTVTCSMTDLADILNSAGDTIFKVNFVCQPTQETILKKLKDFNGSRNTADIKKLTKAVVEGEETTIVGHLAEGSQSLGRTLVIDLEAGPEGFKQVDHRTIKWIILKNTKYVLGKKSAGANDQAPKELNKWDQSKLAVGNWFSEVAYYKYKSMSSGDYEVTVRNKTLEETYLIPKE